MLRPNNPTVHIAAAGPAVDTAMVVGDADPVAVRGMHQMQIGGAGVHSYQHNIPALHILPVNRGHRHRLPGTYFRGHTVAAWMQNNGFPGLQLLDCLVSPTHAQPPPARSYPTLPKCCRHRC